MSNRIDVLHGVNLDQLERRSAEVYGGGGLRELEVTVGHYAGELGLQATFWQTNHEGEYCESLHLAHERADGLILNPGAWTHYSYAIRDALEVSGLPAVEVHISDVMNRDDWRAKSVIRDLCVGTVAGKGVAGYRDALELLKAEFEGK